MKMRNIWSVVVVVVVLTHTIHQDATTVVAAVTSPSSSLSAAAEVGGPTNRHKSIRSYGTSVTATSITSIRGGATTASSNVMGRSRATRPSNHQKKKKKNSSPDDDVIRGTGTATMTNEILNLVKGIVGVGVLSLPAGIGNFGNHPSVLFPSLFLITAMGILSAYGFAIIGKVCSYTDARSYREAWSLSIGEKTSWIPALSATCKTFLACLALSMVLADTFVGLFRLNIDARTQVLVTLTTVILLPLCWMKNLSALAPFSLLGILGMGFTGIAMTVRYLDQSYAAAAATTTAAAITTTTSGIYYNDIASHLRPSFGTAGWTSVFQPNSLILLCMLSTAYMAHFNAPKFYQELYNHTLPRFHTVVASSFGISILMIGYITAIGFLTFGSAASGLVLNNYSALDGWMSASRIAVAVALVFSYPLAFQGCRDGILDLIQLVTPIARTPTTLNGMTIGLLVLLTALAASLKDVSFVLALGGGTMNSN
jgi:amino acid permease